MVHKETQALREALKHQACYNRVRSFSPQRDDNISLDQLTIEKAAQAHLKLLEVSTTEAEHDNAEESSEEPKVSDGVQKRLDKMTYEKHQARREAEEIKRELADLKAWNTRATSFSEREGALVEALENIASGHSVRAGKFSRDVAKQALSNYNKSKEE